MEFNIEVRKKQLQSLDQYISSSRDKVQSILDYLSWNAKKVLEKEPVITCSLNRNHRIPLKNTEQHLKKCTLTSSGYNLDDQFLSEPLDNDTGSIKIEKLKKIELLEHARNSNSKFKTAWNGQDSEPMTADRILTTYSSDERLAFYNYSIKTTESPPVPSEFNISIDDKQEKKSLTHEEQLAKERDAKRRRVKYKSVHTGKSKSYTEVMKEVIDNQMELYKEYLVSKEEKDVYSDIEQNKDLNSYYPDITNIKAENVDTSLLYTYSTDISASIINNKKEKKTENNDRLHSSVHRHRKHSRSPHTRYKKKEYEHKNYTHNIEGKERKIFYHRSQRKYKYDGCHDQDIHKDKRACDEKESYKEKRATFSEHKYNHSYGHKTHKDKLLHYEKDSYVENSSKYATNYKYNDYYEPNSYKDKQSYNENVYKENLSSVYGLEHNKYNNYYNQNSLSNVSYNEHDLYKDPSSRYDIQYKYDGNYEQNTYDDTKLCHKQVFIDNESSRYPVSHTYEEYSDQNVVNERNLYNEIDLNKEQSYRSMNSFNQENSSFETRTPYISSHGERNDEFNCSKNENWHTQEQAVWSYKSARR